MPHQQVPTQDPTQDPTEAKAEEVEVETPPKFTAYVKSYKLAGVKGFYPFGEYVEYSQISYLRKNISMGNVGSLDL